VPARRDAVGDGRDLRRRLADPEDHLWKALTQVALRVHAREAQVVERGGAHGVLHPARRLGRSRLAGANLFKKRVEFLCGHASKKRSRGALAI
jgi:hypothetical protein